MVELAAKETNDVSDHVWESESPLLNQRPLGVSSTNLWPAHRLFTSQNFFHQAVVHRFQVLKRCANYSQNNTSITDYYA